MDSRPQLPTADRSCPIGFVVLPSFIGALVWLYLLLSRMPAP
jgi:hypothetical protein